jgi:oxalate decarboxylase/phosphoglucose isomerase-like protein (cupin superfamily)
MSAHPTVPSSGFRVNDEAFFLLDGELEFLGGDKTFTASTGDFVFVPRGIRHRFRNTTSAGVKMAFLFTPGGQEEFFLRYGDDPCPATRRNYGPSTASPRKCSISPTRF